MSTSLHGQNKTIVYTTRNRLNTYATTRPEYAEAAETGKAYILTSGWVTIANLSQNAMLYLKNTSGNPYRIQRLGAGGGNAFELDLLRGPTTGTIITDASPATTSGMNPRLQTPLDATAFKPTAASKTFTNGTNIHPAIVAANTPFVENFGGALSIEPGGTIGLRITPKSATSSNYYVNMIVYHI